MIRRGVLNGNIPSAVFDTAATLSCAPTTAPLRNILVRPEQLFMVTTGDVAPASAKLELPYDVCGEAKEVDLAPKMQGTIILSTGKCAKEGYVMVYDKEAPPPQTSRLMTK